jgi:hypothetical protein
MKINKKLPILLGVITLSYISTFLHIQPIQTQAALTAPTSYDYSFQYNGFEYVYTTSGGHTVAPTSVALFDRTPDSTYFNYTHTFSNSGSHSNPTNFNFPQGLDITMTFNRSNTSWTDSSPTFTGYYATENKIGSNNTVGSVRKTYLQFDNQTNKDYYLYLDFSSSAGNLGLEYTIDTYRIGREDNTISWIILNTSLAFHYIPAFSNVIIHQASVTFATYFDAWYLKDLGVSEAWQQGYDAGNSIGISNGFTSGYQTGLNNNPNVLLNGFQAMVGILVNFFLMIINLEVFGVSLSSMFAILALFVGLIWFLKILRG